MAGEGSSRPHLTRQRLLPLARGAHQADQLLAALPVIGGVLGLEDRDAALRVALLAVHRLPDSEQHLPQLGLGETVAIEHSALEVGGTSRSHRRAELGFARPFIERLRCLAAARASGDGPR